MERPQGDDHLPENGQETALLISPAQQDHETLQELFAEERWNLLTATSLNAALTILRQQRVAVVITEQDLALGDWKDVLSAIGLMSHIPILIVISRIADAYLWSEALNLGAYDVMAKPLHPAEVIRVLNSAWRHARLRG